MSDGSAIEWTDATWNPLLGCTKVSPGCDGCYAVTTARIRESNPNAKISSAYAGIVHRDDAGRLDWTSQVNLLEDRLDQPLRWKKPRRIFVNSQADLFHDQVSDEYIARVFAVMALAPHHTFQVLSKRHGRMRSLLLSEAFVEEVRCAIGNRRTDGSWHGTPRPRWPLPNVHLGVSVENQQWASIRIPALVHTPAAVRILSLEPLLGPVDLDLWKWLIDWVIVGGESGHGARPMHPDWARSVRDQCTAAGVPFLFKQWGDGSLWGDKQGDVWTPGADGLMHTPETAPFPREYVERKWGPLKPLSKKAAGRELDGRTWDEYPKAAS